MAYALHVKDIEHAAIDTIELDDWQAHAKHDCSVLVNLATLHEHARQFGNDNVSDHPWIKIVHVLKVRLDQKFKAFDIVDKDCFIHLVEIGINVEFNRCLHIVHRIDEFGLQKAHNFLWCKLIPMQKSGRSTISDRKLYKLWGCVELFQISCGTIKCAKLLLVRDAAFERLGQFHLSPFDHAGAYVCQPIAAPIFLEAGLLQHRACHGDAEGAEVIFDLKILGRAQNLDL